MDLNKLTMSERLISGSAIALFVASFLTWFQLDTSVFDFKWNGWEVGFLWGALPTILGLVMLAHVVVTKFVENVQVPDLPWSRIHLIAGIVAAALVVLKMLIGAEIGGQVDLDRGLGLFLAALAAIGLGVGGFLYYKEHEDSTTTT